MGLKKSVEKTVLDSEGKEVLDSEGKPKLETVEEDYTDDELQIMFDENKSLKSNNSRLLNESTDYKKKYNQEVATKEAATKKKLEEDGKTTELLEAEKEDNKKLRDNLVATKTRTIRTKLENEILKLAPNCHDVDDIISNLSSDKYSIDSENETVSGVKEALADVQKRKPYLFSLKQMPDSFNKDPDRKDNKNGKKMLTVAEYQNLPTKKEMLDAMAEGRVEGLSG